MNPLTFGNGGGSGMNAPIDTSGTTGWNPIYNGDEERGIHKPTQNHVVNQKPGSLVFHPISPVILKQQVGTPSKVTINKHRKEINFVRDGDQIPDEHMQPFDNPSQGTREYYFAPGQSSLTQAIMSSLVLVGHSEAISYQDDVVNYQGDPSAPGGSAYLPYSGDSDFIQDPRTWRFQKMDKDVSMTPYKNQTNSPEPPNVMDIGNESTTFPIEGSKEDEIPTVEEWLRSIGESPANGETETVNEKLADAGEPKLETSYVKPKEAEEPVSKEKLPEEIKEVSEGPLPSFTPSQIDSIVEKLRKTKGSILNKQKENKDELGTITYQEPDFIEEVQKKKGEPSYRFRTVVTRTLPNQPPIKYRVDFVIGKKASNSKYYSLFPSDTQIYVVPKDKDASPVSWEILTGELAAKLTNYLWTKTNLVSDSASQVGADVPESNEKVATNKRTSYNVFDDPALPEDMTDEEKIFTTITDFDSDGVYTTTTDGIDRGSLTTLEENPKSSDRKNKYFFWEFLSPKEASKLAKKDLEDKGFSLQNPGQGVLLVKELPKWKKVKDEVQRNMGNRQYTKKLKV
jgi:hypothetical protein